jgi:hypothetical protein
MTEGSADYQNVCTTELEKSGLDHRIHPPFAFHSENRCEMGLDMDGVLF